MSRRLRLTLGLASLAAAGCGGGGGSSVHTARIPAEPGLCGWVTATGDYAEHGEEPIAGDLYLSTTGVEEGRRGFLSFDISSIPPTATVVSATLRVRIQDSDATAFEHLGKLVLDQVVYGDVLDAGAYDRAFPANQAFVVLATDTSVSETEVDATAPVQSDLVSMRTRSQFRMRFELETYNDQQSQLAVLSLYGDFAPVLVVRWQ